MLFVYLLEREKISSFRERMKAPQEIKLKLIMGEKSKKKMEIISQAFLRHLNR
jgi:hypothetical protein